MERRLLIIALLAICAVMLPAETFAQRKAGYSYPAQARFIPKELGRVYLGMTLRELAKQIELKAAEIEDDRFEALAIRVPIGKGNVADIVVMVQGYDIALREAGLRVDTVKRKTNDSEEYEAEVKRPIVEKIPAKAFVYAIYVEFKPEFDLKSYVVRTYGPGKARSADDPYHFSDIEWTKRTSDGLLWLIRSLHEGDRRTLQLLGRIKGTEWGIE